MTFLLAARAFLSRIPWQVYAAIALVIVTAVGVTQCSKRHDKAAQARVDASQQQAATNSAADAINAVAASGARETASEDLTRSNAREIANAPGASERVNSGVDLAGRKALCRRAAYANDPKCGGLK